MFIDPMFINPAILTACIAILMALIAVGGILWRLSGIVGDVKLEVAGVRKDVAVVVERLDGHIKACDLAPKKSSA